MNSGTLESLQNVKAGRLVGKTDNICIQLNRLTVRVRELKGQKRKDPENLT